MVRAVLFDVFGTLFENGTYSPSKQSLKIFRVRLPYGKFILTFGEAFMTQRFDDQREAFEHTCSRLQKTLPPFVIDKLIGVWNKNKILAEPYEDTFETLTALREKGIKTVLFCNMDNFTFDFLKDKFDLEKYFDHMLPSCETGFLKLHKQSFTHALDVLGLKKEDVLMVGDSVQSDIIAAEQAGVSALLVDRRDTREHEPKILGLKELLERV